MIRVVLLVKVTPKARPRIGKYGNIYSPSSKDEQDLGLLILREMRLNNIKKFQKDKLSVKLRLGLEKNKRADIDNYIKMILDSCNGILWDDDKNIYELSCKVKKDCLNYLMIEVEKIEKWVKGDKID